MAEAVHLGAFIGIVRDRIAGRVDLQRDGSARVRYEPGPPERALPRRTMVEQAWIHRAAGARRLITLHTPPLVRVPGGSFDVFVAELERRPIAPNRVLPFTARPMSSCRIGRHLRDSVADPDGQAWGVRGLFVADASALPTACGVNPMLSVMAVARRTAERMAASWRRRQRRGRSPGDNAVDEVAAGGILEDEPVAAVGQDLALDDDGATRSRRPGGLLYPCRVTLYRLDEPAELVDPIVVVAFDGWVDAGSAATTAASHLAEGAEVIGRFTDDLLYDYRARRPTLEIQDGHAATLTWPELLLRRRRVGGRDLLLLSGPEPDYRWRELTTTAVELARRLRVSDWMSLGAIPAAVPHTRPVTILGTESRPGLLRGGVNPGPEGVLTVPAAAISVLDFAVAEAGIATVGYFAQVPHYLTGPYPAAAVELLHLVSLHLHVDLIPKELQEEVGELRVRLDAATAANETTRLYVERLEGMVDEARLPAGDDLIVDIERFLREQGDGGRERS